MNHFIFPSKYSLRLLALGCVLLLSAAGCGANQSRAQGPANNGSAISPSKEIAGGTDSRMTPENTDSHESGLSGEEKTGTPSPEEQTSAPADFLPEEQTSAPALLLPEESTDPAPEQALLFRASPDGSPAHGWVTDDDGTVGYCGDDGLLLTGFQILDGSRYYFTDEGDRVTGAYTLEDGSRVLFTEDGRQYLNSVAKMDDALYFFGPDGFIVIGDSIPLPGGGTGMTDSEGRLYTGCHRFGSEVYTFTSLGRFRHKINADTPMVALTYDDGPSEQNTPVILDALREYGAHATFFVCGRNVDRCRDIIQAEEDCGCEVANHTYNHYMIVNMDAAVTFQEISSTSSYVQMITGNRPSIMRPPTGAVNEPSRANVAAVDDGYPLIIWSLDTVDWQHHDPAVTIDRVLTQVKDGSIVLMHDMEDSSAVASQTLIPELIARGYQLVTVSELAAARGIQMKPGEEYHHFYPEEALPVSETLPDSQNADTAGGLSGTPAGSPEQDAAPAPIPVILEGEDTPQ